MNFDHIEIRMFQPDDQSLVEDFFNQMSGETRGFFNRDSGNEKDALSFFDGKDKNKVRWLAIADGRMIGYVFLWETNKSIPWLGIAVSEDFKGKHLGRLLLQTAKDYVLQNRKGGILLTTHIANLRGQGLYERCGYERMGMHNTGEILYLLRLDA